MTHRWQKMSKYYFGIFAFAFAIVGSGVPLDDVYAANSYVQGSYSAAIAFANDFCSDTSTSGVGPTYNGIGDLVWITAPGGGGTITANRDDLFAPVEVHIAGKFCGGYNGSNGGSDYRSDKGGISGRLMYGGNTANTIFNVSKPASLYIGDLSEGTHRINMSLSSFYTLPSGREPTPKDSPNAWTDLVIDYTDRWSINGQSYVRNSSASGPRSQGTITANLNDVVHWDHDLRNNGPDDMERDIYYNVDKTGYSGSESWVNGNKDQKGFARGGVNQLFVALYAPNSPYTVKTIGQQDVGAGYDRPPICQNIAWQDKAWDDGSWGWSMPSACVRVPYNYNLTPGVSGPNGVASVGSPIPSVMPTITNQLPGNPSQTTVSEPVEWQLKRVQVNPGGSIPTTQQENGTAPCAHYGNNCIDKGSGTQAFPAGNTPLAALNNEMVDGATAVGTKICYTLSVRPYTQTSGNWRHSAPVCMTVSKQPKVQVWGGDVRTRGNIKTGTTLISDAGTNKLFGSWVEYGGFSVGANEGFASAAGLNNGTTNTTAADMWHKLTFANIDDSGANSFGRYTLDGLPTITDQFIGAASAGGFNSNLGALESGTYAVGDVNIATSTVGQSGGMGKSIIIVSSGTVTINGDITYSGTSGDTFTALDQIPQVVIIARNINITNAVGRVDAWLLTRGVSGTINTCSDRAVTAPLNSKVCDKLLTVNGPVVTDHLYLRRTAGSENAASAGTPAEVFNLRSDAYVWAYGRAGQAGKAQTVDSLELPPRF